MSNFKIVFIHGWTASHLEDWYPYISEELDKLGVDYIIPDLPGGEYPHAEEWLEVLHKKIIQTNKQTISSCWSKFGNASCITLFGKISTKS